MLHLAKGLLKPSLGALPLQAEEGKINISLPSQYETMRFIADGLASGQIDTQAGKLLLELLPKLVDFSERAERHRKEDNPIRKQLLEFPVEARENIRVLIGWIMEEQKRRPRRRRRRERGKNIRLSDFLGSGQFKMARR